MRAFEDISQLPANVLHVLHCPLQHFASLSHFNAVHRDASKGESPVQTKSSSASCSRRYVCFFYYCVEQCRGYFIFIRLARIQANMGVQNPNFVAFKKYFEAARHLPLIWKAATEIAS